MRPFPWSIEQELAVLHNAVYAAPSGEQSDDERQEISAWMRETLIRAAMADYVLDGKAGLYMKDGKMVFKFIEDGITPDDVRDEEEAKVK